MDSGTLPTVERELCDLVHKDRLTRLQGGRQQNVMFWFFNDDTGKGGVSGITLQNSCFYHFPLKQVYLLAN